jgi:hypothetical protein
VDLIPGEIAEEVEETMIQRMCRLKTSLTTNVIVAFLVLTVVR